MIGEHDGFPVENMSLSHGKTFLASCSHDQSVRFWNVTGVENEKIDTSKKAKRTNRPKMLNKALAAQENFFGDLMEKEEGGDKEASDEGNSDEEDSYEDDSDQQFGNNINPNTEQSTSCKQTGGTNKQTTCNVENESSSDDTDS